MLVISQTGWLKPQRVIFSQFWRLEVREQGAAWLASDESPLPWLADGCLLTVSSDS